MQVKSLILLLFVFSGIILGCGRLFYLTPYMILATFSVLFLSLGLYCRKKRNFHVPLMLSGIVLDLIIVIILEFSREAVKTAVSFSLSMPQQVHILFSVLAVVFYIPTVVLGLKLLKGTSDLNIKKWHLRSGVSAFVFRWIGFLFMFSYLH